MIALRFPQTEHGSLRRPARLCWADDNGCPSGLVLTVVHSTIESGHGKGVGDPAGAGPVAVTMPKVRAASHAGPVDDRAPTRAAADDAEQDAVEQTGIADAVSPAVRRPRDLDEIKRILR
jgi:hypothetical protein